MWCFALPLSGKLVAVTWGDVFSRGKNKHTFKHSKLVSGGAAGGEAGAAESVAGGGGAAICAAAGGAVPAWSPSGAGLAAGGDGGCGTLGGVVAGLTGHGCKCGVAAARRLDSTSWWVSAGTAASRAASAHVSSDWPAARAAAT